MGWEGGRPALRSFLPSSNGLVGTKGCRQAADERPRMYLACSDGITSEEERGRARDAEGVTWREVPHALVVVLGALTAAWPDLLAQARPAAEELLERTLLQALDELDASPGWTTTRASASCCCGRPRTVRGTRHEPAGRAPGTRAVRRAFAPASRDPPCRTQALP